MTLTSTSISSGKKNEEEKKNTKQSTTQHNNKATMYRKNRLCWLLNVRVISNRHCFKLRGNCMWLIDREREETGEE